jgi:hypothetical protein
MWGVASSEEYESLYRNTKFDQKGIDSPAQNFAVNLPVS